MGYRLMKIFQHHTKDGVLLWLHVKGLWVVRMGNDQCCPIVGRDSVILEIGEGTKLTLSGVRHVPGVRMNLLSIRVLDNEG